MILGCNKKQDTFVLVYNICFGLWFGVLTLYTMYVIIWFEIFKPPYNHKRITIKFLWAFVLLFCIVRTISAIFDPLNTRNISWIAAGALSSLGNLALYPTSVLTLRLWALVEPRPGHFMRFFINYLSWIIIVGLILGEITFFVLATMLRGDAFRTNIVLNTVMYLVFSIILAISLFYMGYKIHKALSVSEEFKPIRRKIYLLVVFTDVMYFLTFIVLVVFIIVQLTTIPEVKEEHVVFHGVFIICVRILQSGFVLAILYTMKPAKVKRATHVRHVN
mmetsp:Transcript_29325/g.32577  ORF Transcript_29325/g.32577 Transcript_29325/m.32577 type:complete len:276 (+) Transcript_29325:201-1028(+)